MKIIFVGDCHGNFTHMLCNLIRLTEAKVEFDTIIQVGDFGFYPGIKIGFPKRSFSLLPPLYFIDGNHEDHEFLNHAVKLRKTFGGFYIPRGEVWVKDGIKIGFMGGAFNVDRRQEVGGINFPSREEISNFSKKINDMGGVDIMVTHSCPGGIGVGVVGHPVFQDSAKRFIEPFGYKVYNIVDIGDEPLTNLYNNLIIKPQNWIFGHFHIAQKSKVGITTFHCIGSCDDSGPFSPLMLDTVTKEIY